MNQALIDLGEQIAAALPEAVLGSVVAYDELSREIRREDVIKALKFLRKRPTGYPSASDPEGKLPIAFHLTTMPTSYLIDQNGIINARFSHKFDITDRVEALLKQGDKR